MKKVVYIKNTKESYVYENDRIIKRELTKEKAIYASLLSLKDIIIYNFKLPLDISEEKLLVEAEKYVFKEAGLDFTKEYIIKYNFNKLENFYLVDAFIIDTDFLIKEFSDILKKVKYIDFITITPFVFSSFYELNEITPQEDAFIHFDNENAYISFYKNGKFLFSKYIEKLSKLSKDLDVSLEELIDILTNKGLNEELYEDPMIYQKVNNFFSQFFIKVNNLVNYSVNLYGLEKISNIYFYIPFKIEAFLENTQGFWNTLGINFDLLKVKSEYDPLDVITTHFCAKNYSNDDINFSIFKKPPPIFQQEIGKVFMLILGGLFIVIVLTGIEFYIISQKEKKLAYLNEQLKSLNARDLKTIKIYRKLLKTNKELKTEYKNILLKVNLLKNKIYTLNNINQNNFLIKYNLIVEGLKKFNLKIEHITINKNSYEILLKSVYSNGVSIGKFLKYLSNNNFKNIKIEKINNDLNETTYSTKVTFND